MSIHVQLTPEAQAKLKAQQRNSTISSVIISALVLTLLALGLYFIFLKPILVEVPLIVTYQGESEKEEEVSKKKVTTQVNRKPSSPSSSMARVIASTSPSNVTIPVPETNTPEPSVEFGDGDDFGNGWGDGDGFGGGGGGGASFFGQTVVAQRVCYVIDYSASMRSGGGERERLMRAEVKKSLEGLSEGMQYQLIFFAGPAWVAGDTVELEAGNKGAIVTSGTQKYEWKGKGGPTAWDPKGAEQVPQWLDVSKSQLKASQKIVKNEKLVWGTDWEHPLEMALSMTPKPQVIYFMTDGLAGDSTRIAKSIGRQAKSDGVTINCVALLEPKAKKDMQELAKRADGQFTLVEKGGKVTKTPTKK